MPACGGSCRFLRVLQNVPGGSQACSPNGLLWQDAFQDLADGGGLGDGHQWDHVLEVAAAELQAGVHVACEECRQQRAVLSSLCATDKAALNNRPANNKTTTTCMTATCIKLVTSYNEAA